MDNARTRRERKFDQRIEYVASDWSLVHSAEHTGAEAAETRRLSAEEEVDLFRRMNFLKHRAERLRQLIFDDYCPPDTVEAIQRLLEESTRLRNYLVQVFSKLAVSVARPYANAEIRLDELLSESHVTLLRCVEIFDADRGYRFSTYATNAIRHNLNRYVSRQRRLRQNTREYVATDGFTAESVENPRRREREYSARMRGVSQWLGELDPREQTILKSRYGLTEDPGKTTLQSLADQLGLSRERIRQLEIRAIQKLRDMASRACLEFEA
ncbi:MAG: sigma-70 family RNA polymerase sigma factor [Pirellulaceae bacterium]